MHAHRLTRRLLATLALSAAVLATTGPIRADAAIAPSAPVQTVGTAGFTPVEPAVRTEAADAAATASINDCIGAHSLPCLTRGTQYFTGKYKYMTGAGGSCPCYYIPVYKRTFTTCKAYEAMSVNLCMNGQVIYANGYAACTAECTVAGLRGYHNCGITGTGSFGWSLEQINCSDSYVNRSTVSRNTVHMCFVKIGVCDTNTYHLNLYYTGGIYGPYNGEGAYS